MDCPEKTVLTAAFIFGGITMLFPSLITLHSYITKWIPESTPEQQKQMKLVLAGSVILGISVVGGGIWYLKTQKCI